jgi:hypothetical protein
MENMLRYESSFKTWIMIVLMMFIILLQGFFSFFVVGDLGQPGWDFRPVKDVPGQSPYAVYPLLPHPQHVRGARGE